MRINHIIAFISVSLLLSVTPSCDSGSQKSETVIDDGTKAGTTVYTEWKPGPDRPQLSKEDKNQAARLTDERPTPGKQTLSDDPFDQSFHLQLGAFTNKTNAVRLINKMEKSGYQPVLVSSEFKGTEWSIVKLGPYKSREEAIVTAEIIAEKEKMNVMVLHKKNIIRTIQYTPPAKPTTTQEREKADPQKKVPVTEKKTEPDPIAPAPQPKGDTLTPASTRTDPAIKFYSFQVGGLFLAENAKSQMKRYQLRGYSPYLIEVTNERSKETWYSIQIGHFDTLEEAVDEAAVFAAKEQVPTHPRSIPNR